MDMQLWLGFAAASLLVALVPGPGVANVIGFAFGSGRRVALAAVAGLATGNAVAMTVSLAGAGAVLGASPVAFTVLTWAGAIYLVAIGSVALLRTRGSNRDDGMQARPPVGARAAYMTSLAVATFHPKTILFFVAFAAQFIRADRAYAPQATILVATFTGIAACTDSLYALGASRAAGLIRRPVIRRWSQRAGGAVLVAAGVAIAVTGR